MSQKLWGGRFTRSSNPLLEKLNFSINLDKRMYAEDIIGSRAYARALNAANLLTDDEVATISKGLEIVKLEWETQQFVLKDSDEDIHTANERRLKELIGDAATKLHVGRSRNDQVVTDMKLWLRSAFNVLKTSLGDVIEAMVDRSAKEIDTLMPGYTHLQKAQPVRWSHWMLSHAWSLKSDVDRLKEISQRVNVMPLGSGAVAGNPFNIDRDILAYTLGFGGVTQNSMQTVSDRDFVVEFLFWSSLVSIHLSRLAEDLIIFSTKEFDFVTIDETFSTGSSLMPQKRNPDVLELIRSICGTIHGHCCGFMMVLKGLPSTYNKDLQNDKESMFGAFDKMKSILDVTAEVVRSLKINAVKCRDALDFDMLATDLAYYLVKKQIPFREAHHLAGKVVNEAERKGVLIHDLTLEELKVISKYFDVDVAKIWNFENSVEQYRCVGGTSKAGVSSQIELLRSWLTKISQL